MSSPGDDKDLEDLLAGRSDLSRRYRASNAVDSQEEPPAELDRAVLARARAAVQSTPGTVTPLRSRSRPQWVVPFALAASVLLTFAIFREGSQKVGVNGDVTTGVVTEQSVAPLSAPAVVATVPAQANEERAESEAVARDAVAQKSVQLQATAPVAAVSPPAAVTPTPAPEVAITTAVPAASGNLAINSIPVPPAPPAAPPASAAVAARAPAAQRASAELVRAESDAAKVERTPEAWLEDVRKLRAAGEGAAADEELKRFLEAYPDYFTKNPGIARP